MHLTSQMTLQWLCLFSFHKQLLPFLKVSTTIGNQAFSHEIDAIYSLDWVTIRQITFLNGLRKNDIEAQVEFTFKVMERVTVTCYWCILTPYRAFQGWWTNNSNATYICTTIYQMLGVKPVAINLQVQQGFELATTENKSSGHLVRAGLVHSALRLQICPAL